jgi:hypothetical protein
MLLQRYKSVNKLWHTDNNNNNNNNNNTQSQTLGSLHDFFLRIRSLQFPVPVQTP